MVVFLDTAFVLSLILETEEYDLKNNIKKKGYGFANDFLDRQHKLFAFVTLMDDCDESLVVLLGYTKCRVLLWSRKE